MIGSDFGAAPGGTPFYILTPRYNQASAGVRVLHHLASELERAGHEAFICWTGPEGVDWVDDVRFTHLTQSISIEHFKTRRTPVCIRPEVSNIRPPIGVDVVYVLNTPGLLGGPTEVSADHVIAYSERLARSLPRCDGVVHLPACDPEFWTPEPGRERAGACVYAGKYVEQHGQQLPPELAHARVIARSGPHAPDAAQIRDILRSSSHCYVFENTSVVTEALLCGCPVVVRPNPFLSEMIAFEELGAWGMAEDDDPASLAVARTEVASFRASYLKSFDRAARQVRTFADEACSLALARRAPGPFPVPRRVELCTDPDLRRRDRAVQDLDVAAGYNILLGREVEDAEIFATVRGRALGVFLADTVSSAEYAALAHSVLEGSPPRPELTVALGLEELKAWVEHRLPLARKAQDTLREALNWPSLHAALIEDVAVAEMVERAGLPAALLARRLLEFSRRSDMRGHVDELAGGLVSGWALDLNAPADPVRVEVSRGGELLVEAVTGVLRTDVTGLAGADARVGFALRTPLLAGDTGDVVVRAGAQRVELPNPFRRSRDGGVS